MSIIVKKVAIFVVFILITFVIWWSPDYFSKDTYFDLGDSIFPFEPHLLTANNFYSWQENGCEGLGFHQGYASTAILYYYGLFSFFKLINIPQWICNRLFFFLPTFFLILSLYYLITAYYKEKVRYISIIIAVFFFITGSPLLFIDPKIMIAVIGLILSMASFEKYINISIVRYILLFSLGILLITAMPRFYYVLLFYLAFRIIIEVLLNLRKFSETIKKIIKFSAISFVSSFLLNCYSFIYTIGFLKNNMSHNLLEGQNIYLGRIYQVSNYKGAASFIDTIRLINCNIAGAYFYYNNNFKIIITWVMLAFIFVPLFIKKQYTQDKKTVIALFLSILTIFWIVLSFHYGLHKNIAAVIPGYWIINNPMHILILLASLYSILLAKSVSHIICLIENKAKHFTKWATLTAFFILLLIVIFINNGRYFNDKMFSGQKWLNREGFINNSLGNHLPYFKLPKEYKDIHKYFPGGDTLRVLVLPLFTDGYGNYSWWHYRPMPEIISKIASFRLGGISASLTNKIQIIYDLIFQKRYEDAKRLMKTFTYDYLLLHKDVVSRYRETEDCRNSLQYWPKIKNIANNNYYSVYEISDKSDKRKRKLFYIYKDDKLELEDLLLDKGAAGKSEGDYIYIKDGRFNVPENGKYILKAKIRPNIIILAKKHYYYKKITFKEDEVRKWKFSAANCLFKYYFDECGDLVFSAHFDGNSKIDEFVQMQNTKINVDLKKYPFIELLYKVGDPVAQTIEIVAGIDFNKDGLAEGHIHGIYPKPAAKEWDAFSYNLLEKAMSDFPDKKYYDLVFLELYPHKLWGIDSSTKNRNRYYSFWLKELKFYKKHQTEFISLKGARISPKDYLFRKRVMKLDNTAYVVNKIIKNIEDAKKNIILTKETFLKKGSHSLRRFEDTDFKCDWIIIKSIKDVSLPKISFNKLNSTKYQVTIRNAKNPFYLVLNESFNNGWKVYLDKSYITGIKERKGISPFDLKYSFQKPVVHKNIIANGYFNSWYIDPKTLGLKENFNFIVYFLPQNLRYIGIFISLVSLAFFIIYLFLWKIWI